MEAKNEDPTKGNREGLTKAFHSFIDTIAPKNSPLAQSGSDVLTPEARAKYEEEKKLSEQPAPLEGKAPASVESGKSFVNPVAQPEVNQSVSTAAAAPAMVPATQSVPVPPDQSGNIDAAFNTYNQQMAPVQKTEADILKEKSAAIQAKMDEDDKAVDKIDPKGFFEGKNTWQKILGGVGMFLGSLTPEGARNVASIIDTEINRDIEMQKTNLQLKRNKSDSRFKMMMDKYGSQEAAAMATKRDAYNALDLQLKKLELNAKNSETRARISQGREELNIRRQALSNDLMVATLKTQKESDKGNIPGYKGSNQNPSIVKDVYDRVSAAKSATNNLGKLEKLIDEGAKNPLGANSDLANQISEALAADLAKAMFGRSSDQELSVARKLLPDITSIFRTDGTARKMIKSLKSKLSSDVNSYATAAGYTLDLPRGAERE